MPDSTSEWSQTTTLLTFTRPVAGHEEQFDAWYEGIHIPQVLQLPCVATAQRFKIAAVGVDAVDSSVVSIGDAPVSHGWLAIYEVTGDPKAAVESINENCANGTIFLDPSFDMAATAVMVASPISARKTAADVTIAGSSGLPASATELEMDSQAL